MKTLFGSGLIALMVGITTGNILPPTTRDYERRHEVALNILVRVPLETAVVTRNLDESSNQELRSLAKLVYDRKDLEGKTKAEVVDEINHLEAINDALNLRKYISNGCYSFGFLGVLAGLFGIYNRYRKK
jgi:hypothetical protein